MKLFKTIFKLFLMLSAVVTVLLFYGCIEEDVTDNAQSTENNTTSIENVTSPESDQSNSPFIFTLNSNGQSYMVAGKDQGSDIELVIPETYNGLPVTEITDRGFSACKYTSVIIPSTITKIGSDAFQSSVNLKSILIPSSVTQIGKYAFYNCISLESVELSPSIETIEEHTFSSCVSLKSIEIPSGVRFVESGAFSSCSLLSSIYISKTVEKLNNPFRWSESIENITIDKENTFFIFYNNCLIEKSSKTLLIGLKDAVIPNDGSVEIIGQSAFAKRITVPDVVIPEGVTHIDTQAFEDVETLLTVTFPSTLKTLGESVFSGCENLIEVKFSEGIEDLPLHSFSQCKNLKEVILPSTLKTIGHYAFSQSGLKSVTIPQNVTTIGESAFYECRNLTEVFVSGNTMVIEKQAFSYCSQMKTLNLPASLVKICEYAFSGCTKLTQISYEGTSQEWIQIIKGYKWGENIGTSYVKCSDKTIERGY